MFSLFLCKYQPFVYQPVYALWNLDEKCINIFLYFFILLFQINIKLVICSNVSSFLWKCWHCVYFVCICWAKVIDTYLWLDLCFCNNYSVCESQISSAPWGSAGVCVRWLSRLSCACSGFMREAVENQIQTGKLSSVSSGISPCSGLNMRGQQDSDWQSWGMNVSKSRGLGTLSLSCV